MEIEQTTIQKTFAVKYRNETYYIDYVNSDGQTLALLNRDNWEIYTEDHELLDIYLFKGDNKAKRLRVNKNIMLANRLVEFCIKHFNDYEPFDERGVLERAEVF